MFLFCFAQVNGGGDGQPNRWATLGVLSIVYISNQWSRSLIFYLVSFGRDVSPDEFMNVALGFSQTQYGVRFSLL